MKRYQMYLEPVEMDAIDKIAELAAVPRSEIVRDIVSLMTHRYGKLITKNKQKRRTVRDPFAPFIGKYSLGDPEAYKQVDEIYYR